MCFFYRVVLLTFCDDCVIMYTKNLYVYLFLTNIKT